MGNYRFRLSDMMPNAWFYKLKDMGRARNQNATVTATATATNTNINTHSLKKKQPTSATTTQQSKPKQAHHYQYPRKSYYFTREIIPSDKFYNSPPKTNSSDIHFPDAPRKSTKQRRLKRRTTRSAPKIISSSVSAGCSCRATIWTKSDSPLDYSSSAVDSSPEPEVLEDCAPEYRYDRVLAPDQSFDSMVAWSSACSCRVASDDAKDIIIDVDKRSFEPKEVDKHVGFDSLSELELPPIITKPAKVNESSEPTEYRRSSDKFEQSNAHGSLSVKVVKEEKITAKEHKTSPVRKCSNSPGVRLRTNSPRIASRKIQAHGRRSTSSSSSSTTSRRSLSDSFAVVKSSFDPQRDFRDSMVEMIVENNIRASKDLEDLLACYLSLNSDEYHELIIKVFKQIWFDLTDVRLK